MKNLKFAVLYLCLLCTAQSFATSLTRSQIVSYASSLKGLKKAELKTAIYNLCQPKTILSYGSGSNSTWSGFVKTDRIGTTLECRNRYSTDRYYFSSSTQTSAISGMNIEHSFPKWWWGGSSNNAYKDLFNLYPSDDSANSKKSNYPMGKVTNASILDDYEKVGTGTAGSLGTINLCEPNDTWKGDFCRSYFYMATIYQNLTWQGTQGLQELENDTWPTLREWAYTLYLEWTRNDRVSSIDVDRNNAIYDIQGNRNLFIDFPELAEYVWGDSIDVAFNPYTSLTSASDDSRFATYQAGNYESGQSGSSDSGSGDSGDDSGSGSGSGDSGDSGSGDSGTTTTVTIDISELATANSWTNGTAYTSINVTPFTLTASGGGNNGKYYTSDNTWRLYNGGSLSITASTGYTITSVTSNPSVTFNIADGVATATFTGTVKFKTLTITYTNTDSGSDSGDDSGTTSIANTAETAYTVAEAKALIDAGNDLTTKVYVKGIISQIDSYDSKYGEITYYISEDGTTTDQFEIYGGLNLDSAKFTSTSDIEVGASVIVYGTLKLYNSTYEMSYGNHLVKYTAPTSTDTDDNLPGDIDVDGDVDMDDLTLLKSYLLDSTTTISAQGLINADINADGTISIADLTQLISLLNQ